MKIVRINKLAVLLVICCFLPSLSSNAARPTEVADAFDDKDPFDINLTPQLFFNTYSGLITREYIMDGLLNEVKELNYSRKKIGFAFDIEFGIYKDLSLGVSIPVYVSESNSWELAGIEAKNSTLLNQKRVRLPGEASLTEEEKDETVPLIPGESFDSSRSGLGDIAFKFRWQPLNDERKAYWASWMLGVDYILSTGGVATPAVGSTDTGGVGMGVNFLHVVMAFSKRIVNPVDPYLLLDYYLPHTVEKSIIDPGQNAGFRFGSEFIVYEKSEEGKFAIDINYFTRYTTEAAKNYTAISDPRGHATREEQFLSLGGGLGMYGDIGKYVRLTLDTTFAHDFEHFITYTYYGKDISGDGIVAPNSTEYSTIFDKYTDEPGRRLKIKDSFVFGLNFGVSARF